MKHVKYVKLIIETEKFKHISNKSFNEFAIQAIKEVPSDMTIISVTLEKDLFGHFYYSILCTSENEEVSEC